jgi:DNA-binding transcriptional LysR family regulator
MENNLELYKIFYTVAKCANISQASEKLYISQPAVSKSIKKLEGITGTILFSRSSRGVKLTEEGKVFYQYIERGLNEISVGEKILDKFIKREQGSFKLGVSTALCKYFLIPKLKNFIKDYPKIEIKIMNNTSSDNLKLLEKGEIDFCVISEPLIEKDSYHFKKLSEIQDIFIASKDYLDSLQITRFNDVFSVGTLMLLEPDNITRKYIDEYFAKNNIKAKPDIEISNLELLAEFAKIGLGITVAIKEFVQTELEKGTLVEIPIKPPIPKRNIGMVYNKNLPLSIAAETFLKYLL